MLKKALLWDENRFYVKTKKVCRCVASFSLEQEHFFTHGMTMPLPRKVQDVTKEQIYVNAISR